LLESRFSSNHKLHYLSIEKLTSKQRLKIKNSIINANNKLNRIFDSFNPFINKFLPGNRLIDLFSSHFYFYLLDRKSTKTRKTYLYKLNKIVFTALDNFKAAIVILDTNIKHNVAMSITYIHIHNSSVIKTIYAINITSTKADLFAIRYSLNQASHLANIEYIVVITDSIHVAKIIFNLSIYSYQIQTLAIFLEIRKFFKRNHHTSLKFWDCPSQDKWLLYDIINKETKKFNLSLIFSYKSSWDFTQKDKCDKILNKWKIMFQALNNKERNFLELLDNNLNIIELTYSKDRSWLKYFGHSNLLCTRATRAIVNHTPISEYHLRFFL